MLVEPTPILGKLLARLLYFFSRPLLLSYTHSMLEMDIQLHQTLPAGPKIIAANHPTTTDPFYVAAMLRQQAYILINEFLFQVPLFGSYLRRSGHIPVELGNGQAALDSALARLKQGKTVVIFPEGDLSPAEGGLHQARTGVARLALASGAPVVPVGIHMDWKRVRLIRSTVHGRVEYGRWYLRGPYKLTVGTALTYQGDVEDRPHVRSVAARVMEQIAALVQESTARLKPALFSGGGIV